MKTKPSIHTNTRAHTQKNYLKIAIQTWSQWALAQRTGSSQITFLSGLAGAAPVPVMTDGTRGRNDQVLVTLLSAPSYVDTPEQLRRNNLQKSPAKPTCVVLQLSLP